MSTQPVSQAAPADTGDGLRVVLKDGNSFGQPGETVVLSHSVARAAIESGHAELAPVELATPAPAGDASEGL